MKSINLTFKTNATIIKCPICGKEHKHREEVEENEDRNTVITHHYEGVEIVAIHDPAFAKDDIDEADLKVITAAYIIFLKHG